MTTTMLDLLDDAGRGRGAIRFIPSESDVRTFDELWHAAERCGRWLASTSSRGGAVGAVLSSSFACAAAIVGTWRTGRALVSLPTPARAMDLDEYRRQIEGLCALAGVEILLVDARYLPLIPELTVRVEAFEATLSGGPSAAADAGDARLVQFTSGSTSQPKGVELDLAAVASNVTAILEVVAPAPGDVACSWLPLSHDMGLVGVFLTALAAGSPAYTGDANVVLIEPETFLRDPGIWLRSWSEFEVSFTAAPNFAFDLARRALARSDGMDLGRMRMCVTGGERINAASLRAFCDATAGLGFDPTALCPAYGLAEATVAVCMTDPTDAIATVLVDQHALEDGDWRPDSEGVELVACGRPVRGMEVEIRPSSATGDAGGSDARTGEIAVRGTSMLSGYLGRELCLDAGGWFATGDTGVLSEGGLHVIGRHDDMLVVGGQNLFASEVEARAVEHPAVRPGGCVVIPTSDGRYAVVAEIRREVDDPDAAARSLRTFVGARARVSPSSVVLIRPGTLPKTPSGKVQRSRVAHAFGADELDGLARVDVARTAV